MVQDPGRAPERTFPPGLGGVAASLPCRCWSSTCVSSSALSPVAQLCRPPGAEWAGGSRSCQTGEKEVAGAFQKSPRQGLKWVSHGASRGEAHLECLYLWRHIPGCRGVRQEPHVGGQQEKVVVSGGLWGAGGLAVRLSGRALAWLCP